MLGWPSFKSWATEIAEFPQQRFVGSFESQGDFQGQHNFVMEECCWSLSCALTSSVNTEYDSDRDEHQRWLPTQLVKKSLILCTEAARMRVDIFIIVIYCSYRTLEQVGKKFTISTRDQILGCYY